MLTILKTSLGNVFKQSFETNFSKNQFEAKQCDDTYSCCWSWFIRVEIAAEMAYNSKMFFKRGNFLVII